MANVYVSGTLAIAAGVLTNRRAPNLLRVSCMTEEDDCLSMRLNAQQLHELSLQYMQWRRQIEGVVVKYCTSSRHMKLFLHYLARGGYYHQVGRAEGLSVSATMLYLHHTAAFFQDIAAK